jgi:type II secretory pathway pseudopilin PulG
VGGGDEGKGVGEDESSCPTEEGRSTMKRRQDLILKRLHALTLIELVVVCAIIVVLVGIVWVVMAPAREKARQAVCLSNLTQIGHAFRMYRDDWDGVEPQKGVQLEYWQLGLPPKSEVFGHRVLRAYLKSESVWYCPSRFLLPTPPDSRQYLSITPYRLNYCDHGDVKMGLSPRYDECMMIHSPAPFVSFKWVVSHVPDWGIVNCEAHHYFYFPKRDWSDTLFFEVVLNDFSVQKRRSSWYSTKLPVYKGIR